MKQGVSVVIVNYRVRHLLEQCLLSLQKTNKKIPLEIIVIDNHSNDQSIPTLRNSFPDVQFIELEENVGFSKANNIGLSKTNCDYLLILNPDTVVSENTIPSLIQYLRENSECGMVTPKLIKKDGSLDVACRRSLPTPWIAFTRLSGLSILFPNSRLFGKYNLTFLDESKTEKVGAISGAFMFFNREIYNKIGGFDERFFMYGEDLDLCARVIDAGYEIHYYPEVTAVHYRGESTRRSNLNKNETFYKAMELFAEKHYQGWARGYGLFLLKIGITIAKSVKQIQSYSFVFPMMFDICIVILSIMVGYFAKFQTVSVFTLDLRVTIANVILVLLSLFSTGSYHLKGILAVKASLKAGFLSGLISATYTFFLLQGYMFSRLVVLVAIISWTILLPLWRYIVYNALKSKWFFNVTKPVAVIIGTDALALLLGEKLKNQPSEYEFVGFVQYKSTTLPLNFSYDPLGDSDDLVRIVKEEQVTDVFFSTGNVSYAEIMKLANKLAPLNVHFKILSSELPGSSVALLDLEWKTTNGLHSMLKTLLRKWRI